MSDNLPERAAIVANKNLVQLDIEQMYRFATGYASAGVFSGAKYGDAASKEDLFVRISAGQAIGLDPYTSVSEFYFVKGKLTMSTNLQLALAKASGKYDYRVEWGNSLQDVGIEKDGQGGFLAEGLSLQEVASWPVPRWCRITVYSMPEREVIGESLWTLVDSWRAKLLKPSQNGEPSNHLKYPRAMLFNRAGSSAIAYYMPDATMIRAYDHGEVEADVWSEPRGPSSVTAAVVRDETQEEEIQDADVDEEPLTPAHDPVTGEVREGESATEAMERMVREEALKPFDPATEPGPAVVPPINPIEPPSDEVRQFVGEMVEDGLLSASAPTWATGEPEPQPTVESADHDPVISPGRRNLIMALAGRAGLTDSRRHEVLTQITGQPHADRIPDRLFQAVLDRLNDEVELAQQEVDAVGREPEEVS